jgi:hypothetical protein
MKFCILTLAFFFVHAIWEGANERTWTKPMQINLTLKSTNRKTGPIPVSTTSSDTCPPSCAFLGHGCYAQASRNIRPLWKRLDAGAYKFGLTWFEFLAKVRALPPGQLWRHNQAGDLPGTGDALDTKALSALVKASAHTKGFTYTHKPLARAAERAAVARANRTGFTISLSGNNPTHADTLADLAVGPVVTVLPDTIRGNVKLHTPAGRRIVVCPATYRPDVTCASCRLCAVASRKVIVGFPAHGAAHKRASAIASQ